MRGKDKERACFRYHEIQPVNLAAPDGSRYTTDQGRQRPMSRSEVWRLVDQMDRRWPERDVLFHLRMLNVCPEGMIGLETRAELLLPETVCESYHVPPVEGGLDRWPCALYDAFVVIRTTHQQVRNERARDAIARAQAVSSTRK